MEQKDGVADVDTTRLLHLQTTKGVLDQSAILPNTSCEGSTRDIDDKRSTCDWGIVGVADQSFFTVAPIQTISRC